MLVPLRLRCRTLALSALGLCLSTAARAQEAGSLAVTEGIDDPKLERRLGVRVGAGGPTAGGAEAPEAALTPYAPPAPEAAVVARAPELPAGAAPAKRNVPRIKVGYRWLNLVAISNAPTGGAGGDETFHVVSIDFYPVSSNFRFGLSTQYGWEDGTFRADGDAFIAQSLSLGGQLPGPTFTPFFEGYAGGGLMQRMHVPALNSKATAYGQLGFDVGTEIFLAPYACLSFALGYLHGANAYARDNILETLSVDTWSFKLGFGI